MILKKKWIVPLIIMLLVVSYFIWIFEYYNHKDEQCADTETNKNLCWNERVINATVNWEDNKFINFFTYGLNKHVEHHYFPTVTCNNIDIVTDHLKDKNIRIGNIVERQEKLHKLIKKRADECKDCN